MDIQSIRKIIFPKVHDIIVKLEEDQHEIKLTLLREIFNDAINSHLNISHISNVSIKSMFSGRGRAWARVNVGNNNPVWVEIRNTLSHEMSTSDKNSSTFRECSNMIDIFESNGFAWMRFSSSSKGFSRFQIRTKGSKLEDHITVRIDNLDLLNSNVVNLEGVPHNLGLEPGIFENNKSVKEIIDVPVVTEDLGALGIVRLEDLINA